jgi:hypothetical protein
MKDSIQSIVPESQGSQRSNVSEDTVSEPNFNDVITLQTEDKSSFLMKKQFKPLTIQIILKEQTL